MNSLEKPLSLHLINLKNNNIILKKNQIKYLLQKYREYKYPADNIFLSDISKISIDLDKNNINMTDLPLCFTYSNLVNIRNKNKLEKYIILTNIFQLNMLKKCTKVFIDGTFKSSPRGFYQVINIAGFYPEINEIIPIFMISTTSKSEYLYEQIFNHIKKIYLDTGHNIDDIPKNIMIDFESRLLKVVKANFQNFKINGCYFHFVKLLWASAKKFGLYQKEKLKVTKILLFILKIMQFVLSDDRGDVFDKTEEYYISEDSSYKKLITYYKKNG